MLAAAFRHAFQGLPKMCGALQDSRTGHLSIWGGNDEAIHGISPALDVKTRFCFGIRLARSGQNMGNGRKTEAGRRSIRRPCEIELTELQNYWPERFCETARCVKRLANNFDDAIRLAFDAIVISKRAKISAWGHRAEAEQKLSRGAAHHSQDSIQGAFLYGLETRTRRQSIHASRSFERTIESARH